MKEIIYNKNGTSTEREIEAPQDVDKEVYIYEILDIKSWFDKYYTQHEQKYNRLIALGKLTDEEENPQDKLVELYETAEIKRARIQELENLLKVE